MNKNTPNKRSDLKLENKSLFVSRHGKLLLPYKDHSEMPFGIIADLASEKLNPPIDKAYCFELINSISGKIPLDGIDEIRFSPSRRCRETAISFSEFIRNNYSKIIPVIVMPKLKEIRFDLRKIHPLSEDGGFDIEDINNKVFQAMANGKDCEHVFDTYERVETTLRDLRLKNGHKKYLLITHDFFMRVMEIYLKNKGLGNAAITYDTLKDTRRNGYLDGFATDGSFSNLEFFEP